MSTYYPISADEMRNHLKIEKGWYERVEGKEIVFVLKLERNPHIEIKVFSGILAGNEQSRNCGKDAIRVCAVNTKEKIGWIKSARVYRVMGWKENLKERVVQVISDAKKRLIRSNPGRFQNPISAGYIGEMQALHLESLQQ